MYKPAKTADRKGLLWKSNFAIGGYTCLLPWSSFLNVSEFITNSVTGKGFAQMSFAYCLASVLAFCTSNHFLTTVNRRLVINTMVCLSSACFFLCVFGCRLFADQSTNQYFAVGMSFLSGYFISFCQSKIAGIAGEAGNHEIVHYNFGTGLAGVVTNALSYIFTRVFPTNDPPDRKRNAHEASLCQ